MSTLTGVPAANRGWHPPMTVRRAHWGRWVASAALLVLLVGAGGWAVQQARALAEAHAGAVPPGVTVDGRSVAGMTAGQLRAALEAGAAEVLDREITVAVGAEETAVGAEETTVTRRELGATANVDAVVEAAVAVGADLTLRDWIDIRWFGGAVDLAERLELRAPPAGAGDDVVERLADDVRRPMRPAAMAYDEDAITFHAAVDGVRVDTLAGKEALEAALAVDGDPVEVVEVPVTIVPATTTLADLGQVLYLDQSEHVLQLWDHGELTGEWPVATGAPGYGTPTGEYFVEELREHPTWGNPAPNGWGADMPAFIGPGPHNPLGVRAINWGGTDHIRFHGTAKEWTIGTDASHGCVRLTNGDVVELFDLVRLGATIVSVE